MGTPSKEIKDEWLKSASKYIILTEECDCDCFLCIRGEHDSHCHDAEYHEQYELMHNGESCQDCKEWEVIEEDG